MSRALETSMRQKLEAAFQPQHIELVNESHAHSVPKNSETHFKLVLVSNKFVGLSRIQRQRLVHDVVSEEMKRGVHALTQRALTPEEWQAGQATGFESPDCRGGSKRE